MVVVLHKEQVADFEGRLDLSYCQVFAKVEVLYTVALSKRKVEEILEGCAPGEEKNEGETALTTETGGENYAALEVLIMTNIHTERRQECQREIC